MAKTINQDVRSAAKSAGIPLWRIAESLGIQDTTFSKWLRRELSPEHRKKSLAAIEQIKGASGDDTES